MSGPLATALPREDNRADDARPGADTRAAPGLGSVFAAGVATAVDSVGQVQGQRLDEAYAPIAAALAERTGKRKRAWSALSWSSALNPIGRDRIWDGDAVWREIARLRQSDPGAFAELGSDRAAFEQRVLTRGGARERDLATLGRAEGVTGTVAGFAGGMVGSFSDPVNLASMVVPGAGATASLARKLLVDGLTNAAVELAQTTDAAERYGALGEDYTLGQAAADVGLAFAGGAAFRGGIEAGGALDRFGYAKLAPVREKIDARFRDRDLARALSRAVPEAMRTPEQDAAISILSRQADIDEVSPFANTYAGLDAHRAKLEAAMEAIEEGRVASPAELAVPRAAAAPPEDGSPRLPPLPAAGFKLTGDRASVAGELARAGWSPQVQAGFLGNFEVEGGYGGALGDGGSASGIAQWRNERRAIFRALFGKEPHEASKAEQARFVVWEMRNPVRAGMTVAQRDAILAAKTPEQAAELIDRFYERSSGAHRSRRQAEARAIFGGEPRQGEADAADSGMVPEDEPPIRPEALDAVRPTVALAGRAIPITQVEAREIGVDAELMQFKSGGDGDGVTARLRGVEQWDSYAAGMVTVWEARDGRRLIADGHQRLGLARKLEAEGHPPIQLNAFVLREADGVTAEKARVITALKNIGEGTGSRTDAAKVLRAVGLDSDEVLRRLPRTDPLIRDGKALARLSDEAFGAVVNDVIAEKYGAAIGHLVEDRALHAGMVQVIHEVGPASRAEGEAIIRQALDAGFVAEVQDSLFGSELAQVGLFAQRARLLGKALGELRKMKGAFQVAARNADALDAAGNRIDVAASTAAAEGNARALALVDALALRKGNAVNDLLNEAAARIGAGARAADVLRDFVAGIRALDLEDLARGAGRADRAGEGAGGGGRAGEPEEPDRLLRDGFDSEQLSPAEADAAEAARPWSDHSDPALFAAPDPRWAEPDGDGAAQAAESLWHDLRGLLDNKGFLYLGRDVTRRVTDRVDIFANLLRKNGGTDEVAAALGAERAAELRALALRWRDEPRADQARLLAEISDQELVLIANQAELDVARAALAMTMERVAEGSVAARAALANEQRRVAALETRQAQEVNLRAASPLRGENVTGEPQDGEMGLALFDAVDRPEFANLLIDIGDGRGELPIGEVRAELDADRAALEAMKACLI